MKFMNYGNWNKRYQEAAGEGGDGSASEEAETSAETTEETSETETTESTAEAETTETEDWRTEYLSDTDSDGNKIDEAELKKRGNMLKRYTDKGQLTKSFFDMKAQIAKGVKPLELADDATEEQIAEYRKAVGLPESVEKYDYEFSDGLVLGDEDTKATEALKEVALSNGIKPPAMSAIVEANLKWRETQMQERTNRDSMLVETNKKALEERWGSDTPHNFHAIDNTFNILPGGDDPDGMRLQFQNSRLPNGDRIFDNPDVMNLFATLARKANPESVLSDNTGGGVGGRLEELTSKMKKDGTLSTGDRNEMARLKDLQKGIMQDNK